RVATDRQGTSPSVVVQHPATAQLFLLRPTLRILNENVRSAYGAALRKKAVEGPEHGHAAAQADAESKTVTVHGVTCLEGSARGPGRANSNEWIRRPRIGIRGRLIEAGGGADDRVVADQTDGGAEELVGLRCGCLQLDGRRPARPRSNKNIDGARIDGHVV